MEPNGLVATSAQSPPAEGKSGVRAPEVQLVPELVRSIYLDRMTGSLEFERGEPRQLYFRGGELFVTGSDPAAAILRELLPSTPERSFRPASEPRLQSWVSDLATRLSSQQRGRWRPDQQPSALLGPLPTVWLVMELAVGVGDEAALLALLGGEDARYRSGSNSPALNQLPGLDIDMTQLLTLLEHPTSVRQLLRGAGAGRLPLLQRLARLRAIGLVTEVSERAASEDQILTPDILQRLEERVGESLESEPLNLEIDRHLRRLGYLIANLRKFDHYELLALSLQAQDEEIYTAYNQLAREVHPSHAVHLGLKGKEEILRVLFEWATEAYLTLSHPTRRVKYNLIMGIRAQVQVDDQQRQEEKRTIARQHYRRAVLGLSEMDYSLAVDLLKEAARLDPQPEYFLRLGQAQAKNPKWHQHALGSFRRALEMSPRDPAVRVAFGEFLERQGRAEDARTHYRAALETMPDNATARTALDRLGGIRMPVKAAKLSDSLRNLFGSSEPK